ncbi:SH3 domain-containing protein [Oceanihabitans sediminis]|uniref:SH3 domain-containing protein n=1 Tax=Oceanihabitans sediminis TaxID=1812012 RepID=UPI003A93FE4E
MKQLFTILFFFIFIFSFAQTNPNHVYVSGYYRSNGTYVKGHYRTAPNSTNRDNFSTRGNTNPYTGQAGYITPDNNTNSTYTRSSYSSPTYSSSSYDKKNSSSSNTTYSNNSTTRSSYSNNNSSNSSYSTSTTNAKTTTVNEIFDIDVSKIYALPSKYVSARKANLRLGPTTITNILTTVERNNKIRIIDDETYSSWTKIIVEVDNGFYIGFLSNSLISENKINDAEQENGPTSVVKRFLKHLGDEEFYSAFSLTNNPSWNKNGGYSWFSSTDAYGGIDYITIYEVRLENAYDNQAVVFADYYASDPLHTSRRWKQIIILEYQYGKWKIIRTKLAK